MYYPYVFNELRHRFSRTIVNVFGIAIGIALFVSINAVSAAYKNAASQPFKDIGTDLIVQRAEKKQLPSEGAGRSMRGVRLPFSNQLFRQQDMAVLEQTDGIAAVAQTLLLWEFTESGFRTIMGVDATQPSVGAVKAREWIRTGRFPEKPDEIALEKHFAKFQETAVGDIFLVGRKPFTVAGLLEIREGAQVAAANIYMPLKSAQILLGDKTNALNVIYLRLENPAMLSSISTQLTQQIKGASVSSTDSFLEIMGGVSKVSEKFALIASIVGFLGAISLIIKTMLSNIVERSHEIGILKAVGWTQRDVQRQLRVEAFLQALVGGFLGLLAGYGISIMLGFFSISIPIPWELNPVPALARKAQEASQVVRLPVTVSMPLALTSMLLSVGAGCVAAFLMSRRTASMKPADSLRQI